MDPKKVFQVIRVIRASEIPLRKIKGLRDLGICEDQDGLFIVAYISDPNIVDKIPYHLRDIRVICEKVF